MILGMPSRPGSAVIVDAIRTPIGRRDGKRWLLVANDRSNGRLVPQRRTGLDGGAGRRQQQPTGGRDRARDERQLACGDSDHACSAHGRILAPALSGPKGNLLFPAQAGPLPCGRGSVKPILARVTDDFQIITELPVLAASGS